MAIAGPAVRLEGGLIGHGYQPPREILGPWGLKTEVHPQINERIYNECYRPVLLGEEKIPDLLSFSFFAPIRKWMKYHHPEDFSLLRQRIATLPDREYRVFGDSLFHAILPLQSIRDQDLLIKMGIKAFEEDFGFTPKGFWPGETAISRNTLQLLAENGYKFVVLREDQLKTHDHNPMFVQLDNGLEIAVLHFSEQMSKDLSLGGDLIRNADVFVDHHLGGKEGFLLLGTDLEMYNHHKPWADGWLRRVSKLFIEREYLRTFSLREKLEKVEQGFEQKYYTEVWENSSWSCAHGLGRWQGTCDGDDEFPVSDAENKDKNELYHGILELNKETNRLLDQISPEWQEIFPPAVLDYKERVVITVDGRKEEREMSAIEVALSGNNFLNVIRRAVAHFYGNTADIPLGDERFSIYLLFAAKLYALICMTSCAWFFRDPNFNNSQRRREREIARDMISAGRHMLMIQKVTTQA